MHVSFVIVVAAAAAAAAAATTTATAAAAWNLLNEYVRKIFTSIPTRQLRNY
jgi:hypothetical protein